MLAKICGAARLRRRLLALPGSWRHTCAIRLVALIGKSCAQRRLSLTLPVPFTRLWAGNRLHGASLRTAFKEAP